MLKLPAALLRLTGQNLIHPHQECRQLGPMAKSMIEAGSEVLDDPFHALR
jgi:hypothetical protein